MLVRHLVGAVFHLTATESRRGSKGHSKSELSTWVMLIDLRLAEKTALRQIPASSTKLRLGSIFLFISARNDRGTTVFFFVPRNLLKAMLAAFKKDLSEKDFYQVTTPTYLFLL